MLLRHKSYRFYKRRAKEVTDLIGEYSHHEVTKAIGDHAEQLVLAGFSEKQFVQRGRNTNEFNGRKWTKTDHELDFIFERDGLAYGVEVKNVLGYVGLGEEIRTKTELCAFLGVRPVFVARYDLFKANGFGLLYDVQMYHPLLKDLAKRMRDALGLPIEVLGSLPNGSMDRFVGWDAENRDPELKAERAAIRKAKRLEQRGSA